MLPAILAGIGAAARSPAVLSVLGGIVPGIASALTGSPTEEEARASVAPRHADMMEKLIAAGLDEQAAAAQADDALRPEIERAMNEGGIPPWLEGAMSVAGGLGGFKLGNMLRSRAAKAAAPAIVPEVQRLPASPFAGRRPALPGPAAPQERGFRMVPPDGGTMPMTAEEIERRSMMQALRSGPFVPRRVEPVRNLGMSPETGARINSRTDLADLRDAEFTDMQAQIRARKLREMEMDRDADLMARSEGLL